MNVFLDFEASSLARNSYPIEVGWVFEDGRSDAYLIRPAPDWSDWDERAAAIHRIDRAALAQATPHDEVAARLVAALTGHDLFASAPSWDGKWLSVLLRAAGHPRHELRLRDTEEAQRTVARAELNGLLSEPELGTQIAAFLAQAEAMAGDAPPAHRALADAQAERQRWLAVRDLAHAEAARRRAAAG